MKAIMRRLVATRADPETFTDLEDIRPIGNMRGGLISNKAGRCVLRARMRDQTVKVYEAHSPQHARFIAAVSATIPEIFPAVLEIRGAWLFTEWIHGKTPTGVIQHQARLLRRIHAHPIKDLPEPGFCYVRDHLMPRFVRAFELSHDISAVSSIISQLDRNGEELRLSHPDLSADNLVETPKGRVVIIDNELLTTGHLPMLDLCNAARSLPQELRDELRSIWQGGAELTPEQIKCTAHAWCIREAGAAFISGRFNRCDSLMQALSCDVTMQFPFTNVSDVHQKQPFRETL